MVVMTPTWYRRPSDDKLVLVLEVFTSVEDGMDEFEVAVLEMTPEYAKQLLNLIDLVSAWKKVADDLQCAQFWNYDVEYFGATYEDIEDDRAPRPLWESKGEYDGRTDTDLLEIGQSGYAEWRAYVKNTDIRLTTSSLSLEDLQRYVDGQNPWPLSVPEQEQQARIAKTVESFSGNDPSN